MVRPTIEPNSNLEPNLRFEFGSVDRTTTLGLTLIAREFYRDIDKIYLFMTS